MDVEEHHAKLKTWIHALFWRADRLFSNMEDDCHDAGDLSPASTADIWTDEQVLDPLKEDEKLLNLFRMFEKNVLRHGYKIGSAHFYGLVGIGGSRTSALGQLIARVCGGLKLNIDWSKYEQEVIQWILGKMELPLEDWSGLLASGSSAATVEVMLRARQEFGNYKANKMRAYVTVRTHRCVDKALKAAGYRDDQIIMMQTNNRGQMSPDILRLRLATDIKNGWKPTIVCVTLGTTDWGTLDPLEELVDIIYKHKCWLHADGAFGGAYLMSSKFDDVRRTLPLVDSLVISAHKGLFAHSAKGMVMVRNSHPHLHTKPSDDVGQKAIPADFGQKASRTDTGKKANLLDAYLQTQPYERGLETWFNLLVHGGDALTDLVEEKMLLAQYIQLELEPIETIKMRPVSDTCVVAFRWKGCGKDHSNEITEELLNKLLACGIELLTSTMHRGYVDIRISTSNYKVHLHQVNLLLDNLKALIAEVDGPTPTTYNRKTSTLVEKLQEMEDRAMEYRKWVKSDLQPYVEEFIVSLLQSALATGPHDVCPKPKASIPDNVVSLLDDLKATQTEVFSEDYVRKVVVESFGHYIWCTTSNQSISWVLSPGAVELEFRITDRMKQSLGFGTHAVGVVVPDVMAGFITALMLARKNFTPTIMVGTTLVYYTNSLDPDVVDRSLAAVGLKEFCEVKVVRDPKDLKDSCESSIAEGKCPCFVHLVEPKLDPEEKDTIWDYIKVCSGHNIQLHATLTAATDGTVGGAAIIGEANAGTVPGNITTSRTSFSVDVSPSYSHTTPLTVFLTADGATLKELMFIKQGAYFRDSEEQFMSGARSYKPEDLTFELSRPCTIDSIWLNIKQRKQ